MFGIKHTIYLVLVLMMGLSGCSSQKKLETQTPFVLGGASYQEWMGGREASGTGSEVRIVLSRMNEEEVSFQNIYFRGKVAKVSVETEDTGMVAIAKFSGQKPDIVMHADPKKEVGNQPPDLNTQAATEFPFELRKDEAVLSYLEDDKLKYTKITGVKQKPARIYPSRPQN